MITYRKNKKVKKMIEAPANKLFLPNARKDLDLLIMPWGPQSSLRGAYGGMFHGRDSLVTARNALYTHRELAETVLVNTSALMGVTTNPASEEERGKIHHEARFRPVAIGTQNSENVFSYNEVKDRWGGEVDISLDGKKEKGVVYYGSVDATAKYLILLGKYVAKYGEEILKRKVTRRDGNDYTIAECAEEAYELLDKWITKDSKRGFLEYQRSHGESIENQILRDSVTSILHVVEMKAALLNHKDRVATIDLQAEAHEALLKAPVIFGEEAMQPKVERWLGIANDLKGNTLDKFWDPDLNYFSSALDYDKDGNERRSKYITSMPGYILGSGMLNGIPDADRRKYLTGLGDTLISLKFITDAGIRGVSTDMAGVLDYLDYHGVAAAWGTETKRIADGWRKEGFTRIASQIYIRFKNAINISGSHREFWFVDPKTNDVCYIPVLAGDTPSGLRRIVATNSPEETQAFTTGPALDLDIEGICPRTFLKKGSWEAAVEKRWLGEIENQRLITDPAVIAEKRKKGIFEIDIKAGQEAEARFRLAN